MTKPRAHRFGEASGPNIHRMVRGGIPPSRRARAFTLVELLVAIGIMTILAGLLYAGLYVARRKAMETNCASNLRQFGLAILNYRTDNRDRMPPWLSSLYPNYVKTPDLYICKSDRAKPKGTQGSKPDESWVGEQFAETDDNLNNTTASDRNPAIRYNSYMYEFSAAPCSWWNGHLVGPPALADIDLNRDTEVSWGETKYWQLDHGDRSSMRVDGTEVPYSVASFPIVRCFWHVTARHEFVINLSYDGRVFISGLKWEVSSR